jgi:hypothetical protein
MNQQFPTLVVFLVNFLILFFLQESHQCTEQPERLLDFNRRVVL